MKRQILILALLTILSTACSDDESMAPIPEGEALEITTNVTAGEDGRFITDVCVRGSRIVVDWGDGKRETVSSEEYATDFLHEYKKGGTYTIKIQKSLIRELIIGNATGTLPKELTIGSCPILEKLRITSLSTLCSFKAANCPKLTDLHISICPLLAEVDVSAIPHLERLECIECKDLSSLDVSNLTRLTYLACSGTRIQALNLENNTSLEHLLLARMPITRLDLSRQTALTELSLSQTQLTGLDITHNENLSTLACISNPMEEIDVTHCPRLTTLDCRDCPLTALDLSMNQGLSRLLCADNLLTTLNVSQNEHLYALSCRKNQLTELNLQNNKMITLLDCGENRMEREALENLFDALPDYNTSSRTAIIAIQGNPGADRCAKQIFEKKGWQEVERLSDYIISFLEQHKPPTYILIVASSLLPGSSGHPSSQAKAHQNAHGVNRLFPPQPATNPDTPGRTHHLYGKR